MNTTWVIVFVIALVAGTVIGFFLRQLQIERDLRRRRSEANHLVEDAQAQAREIGLKARDKAISSSVGAKAAGV